MDQLRICGERGFELDRHRNSRGHWIISQRPLKSDSFTIIRCFDSPSDSLHFGIRRHRRLTIADSCLPHIADLDVLCHIRLLRASRTPLPSRTRPSQFGQTRTVSAPSGAKTSTYRCVTNPLQFPQSGINYFHTCLKIAFVSDRLWCARNDLVQLWIDVPTKGTICRSSVLAGEWCPIFPDMRLVRLDDCVVLFHEFGNRVWAQIHPLRASLMMPL